MIFYEEHNLGYILALKVTIPPFFSCLLVSVNQGKKEHWDAHQF